MPSDRKPNYSIVAKANNEAEVMIYDEIGHYVGLGAKQFRNDLKALGPVSTIHLRLNSPGGEVFDGLAIYNTLKDHAAKVITHVDGMALSMASVIAMAGDEIEMADNAFLMIHNPMNLAMGDAGDMRHMADLLDKVKGQLVNVYAERSKQPADKIAALMDAETWLTADEAIALGLADRTSGVLSVAASFDTSRFQNCPEKFRGLAKKEPTMAQEPTKIVATLPELKAGCPGATSDFILACLERGDTLAAAQTAHMQAQADSLKASQAEAAALKAAAEEEDEEEDEDGKKKAKGKEPCKSHHEPGVEAGTKKKAGGRAPSGDAIEEFNALVRENMAQNKDRRMAIRLAARQNPGLHQEYVLATNKPAVHELINQRFAG